MWRARPGVSSSSLIHPSTVSKMGFSVFGDFCVANASFVRRGRGNVQRESVCDVMQEDVQHTILWLCRFLMTGSFGKTRTWWPTSLHDVRRQSGSAGLRPPHEPGSVPMFLWCTFGPIAGSWDDIKQQKKKKRGVAPRERRKRWSAHVDDDDRKYVGQTKSFGAEPKPTWSNVHDEAKHMNLGFGRSCVKKIKKIITNDRKRK